MSRYLILSLLNLPFVFLALVGAVTRYKLGHSTRLRMVLQLVLWTAILMGLVFAEPLYSWLLSSGYTKTEPLSLFDVIQITAIVVVFYIANRLRAKVEVLERRANDLHRELSIKLASKN